jgi:hypothetical protein
MPLNSWPISCDWPDLHSGSRKMDVDMDVNTAYSDGFRGLRNHVILLFGHHCGDTWLRFRFLYSCYRKFKRFLC